MLSENDWSSPMSDFQFISPGVTDALRDSKNENDLCFAAETTGCHVIYKVKIKLFIICTFVKDTTSIRLANDLININHKQAYRVHNVTF